MAEHDLDALPVLAGYAVEARSVPPAPNSSPSPPGNGPWKADTAYEFLCNYARSHAKPGDTVRVNGVAYSDVDDALRALKGILYPRPSKRKFFGQRG